MAVQPESSAEEIRRLRRCISNLVSILALPATWSGIERSRIISDLSQALVNMLNLDFVYARLMDSSGHDLEIVRTTSAWEPRSSAQEIGETLRGWLSSGSPSWPHAVRSTVDGREMSVVPLQLGVHGEMGIIIAGSQRADFPQEIEGVVLSVAANQVAIGLREADVLSALDQRVAERTAELVAVNEELEKEITDRRKKEEELRLSEEALRESEYESRLIVDSIPAQIGATTERGEVESANRQLLEYTGQSLEQIQHWASGDIYHPEDLPHVVQAFTQSIASGDPAHFEVRVRRFDGVYRWSEIRGLPLRDRQGRIVRWYFLQIDVDERKRAEEALKSRERNLRLIIDTIPALVWCNLPDGANEFLSKGWHEYTGLAPEESRGWGWQASFHPDDLPPLMKKWNELLVSGEPGEIEARLRRHDGVYRWFLIRVEPFLDDAGNILRWYGTSTDIADRKRAEEELRRNEEFLSKAQRLSGTGSFSWCIETDEITFSEEAYRIFEFERDALVTMEKIAVRVHPEDLPLLAERTEAARSSGEGHDYEIRLLMPDGSVKYLHATSNESRDARGRREYIGAIQDVTQRRFAQDALNKARSELAHVSRVTALSALTASIAHEVNQPLSGIVTNAGTCLRMLDASPPNLDGARETARRTIRDGNRASEVITRLRALFTRKSVTFELFDLNEAVREVIALSVSELQRDRVILQPDLATGLPSVLGDRIQIQQVILNLIRNGSDAMSAVDDRRRDMLIKTESEESGGVRLSVKDSGAGFAPQFEEKLFEAFYTTKGDGMGIGLSVSRSIMESHRGRLWAVRNEGPGATFSFSIPCGSNAQVQ